MKRFIATLLSVLILLCCGPAAASSIDLEVLSDDEILVLAQRLQAELVKRKIEKTATLPDGSYTIGKDIPAGTYILKGMHEGTWWTSVYLYTAEEMLKEEDSRKPEKDITLFDSSGEKVYRLVLRDGDVLIVSGKGKVTLTISSGLVFE